MTLFSLHININPCEIPGLINSGYRLCVARKVGNDYTIVWKAIRNICMTNVFHFSSDFEVFGQRSCRSGSHVSCAESVPTAGGQKIVLGSHGKFRSEYGSISNKGLTLVSNQHVLTYFGMSCYDYQSKSKLPMFLQKHPTCYGFSACLFPTKVLKVWFQREVSSGTILTMTENSYEVDLSDGSKTITFLGRNLWYEGSGLTFCIDSSSSVKIKSLSLVKSPTINYTIYLTHAVKSNYNCLVYQLASHLEKSGYTDISIDVDCDYCILYVALKKKVEYEEINNKCAEKSEDVANNIQLALLMMSKHQGLC